MREELYFVIMGKPENMKMYFPKLKRFYKLRQAFEDAPTLYGLAFSVDKFSKIHPMIQGMMCIPGNKNIDTDLHIVNDKMAEFGKDRHSGRGLHIERLETREAMEHYILSCKGEIINL